MKRARILLRVSSNQQLEKDGDLKVQRQIVKDYIELHEDWILDPKEYFEGSNSGYKNAVADRNLLQEALQDARRREYDILVVYKDDRIGRRMWEIGQYVMDLKINGVDIFTVKDGCISPSSDDIMGQMMLALRYGNAQKSSADTGARVKDTAQKLVQKGKFMGGCAPYGYQLEYSGEISKHGRALHHLVIIPEQAEAVRYIYELSLNKEFGSQKIAQVMNGHDRFKSLAPRDIWKGGTITSILTNPIYAGYTAYRRREHVHGKYRRLCSEDWITSFEANKSIMIIDADTWNRTQEKRRQRSDKYTKKPKGEVTVKRNDGMLALVDICHCGYCGRKMTNGSKYSYWTIKGTGEKRTSKIPVYKCPGACQGILHDGPAQYRADKIEPVVFAALAKCVGILQKDDDIMQAVRSIRNNDKKGYEDELKREMQKLEAIKKKIHILEDNIADAITGTYPFTSKQLAAVINRHRQEAAGLEEIIRQKEKETEALSVPREEKAPTWQDIFLDADIPAKRVLSNHLAERITVKKDEIVIRLKFRPDSF